VEFMTDQTGKTRNVYRLLVQELLRQMSVGKLTRKDFSINLDTRKVCCKNGGLSEVVDLVLAVLNFGFSIREFIIRCVLAQAANNYIYQCYVKAKKYCFMIYGAKQLF
jgi:hypothetical protein